MGRPARRRPTPRQPRRRTAPAAAFIPLLIVDEVGYIPFDPQAANLHVHARLPPLRTRLDDRHQQQAASAAWGEIFGDDVVAAAMIDRLVHHAEILALKGDSYRLRDKRPRRPQPRQERRNRLTDHPRRTSPRAAERPYAPRIDRRPPETAARRTIAAPPRPTGSAPRRPGGGPRSVPRWTSFQPAKVDQISTGLDTPPP